MRLNHLNLCVENLPEARDFFQSCFDLTLVDQPGERIAIMTDGAGFTLTLSGLRSSVNQQPVYPDGFHIGFLRESPEEVEQVYHRLADAGIDLGAEPRRMRGVYGFYFTALNTILFEVSCPL